MLITNPLTTIGPCMARERFCAMQSPFQIRICRIHDEHGYCDETVIIKATTDTIFLPPLNVTRGLEGMWHQIISFATSVLSAHYTASGCDFTSLAWVGFSDARDSLDVGCLERLEILIFCCHFLRVPSRSSKLALELDMCALNIFTENVSKTLWHKSSIHYTLHLRGQPRFSVLSSNFGVQTCYTLLQLMLRQAGLKGPFFRLRPPMNETVERINR